MSFNRLPADVKKVIFSFLDSNTVNTTITLLSKKDKKIVEEQLGRSNVTLEKGATFWALGNMIDIARSSYKHFYHLVNPTEKDLLGAIPQEKISLFPTMSAAKKEACKKTAAHKKAAQRNLFLNHQHLVTTIFEVCIQQEKKAIQINNNMILTDTNGLLFVKGGVESDSDLPLELNYEEKDVRGNCKPR